MSQVTKLKLTLRVNRETSHGDKFNPRVQKAYFLGFEHYRTVADHL